MSIEKQRELGYVTESRIKEKYADLVILARFVVHLKGYIAFSNVGKRCWMVREPGKLGWEEDRDGAVERAAHNFLNELVAEVDALESSLEQYLAMKAIKKTLTFAYTKRLINGARIYLDWHKAVKEGYV